MNTKFILTKKIDLKKCESCGKIATLYLKTEEKFLPFCDSCAKKESQSRDIPLKILEEKSLEPLKILASKRSAFSENINLHFQKKQEKSENDFEGLFSALEGLKFEEEFSENSSEIFEKNFKFSHEGEWVKIKVLPKKNFDVYFTISGELIGKFDKLGAPIVFY